MNCIYKDPSAPIEARVQDLLSRMTLQEKIGQMTQIERSVATPSAIKDLSIGQSKITVSLFSVVADFA
ncbi:UNVERIFIED_CONTAM: hypothetical protein Sradi_0171800 [Sesamum radiatum]|uniref:Uncharacterized protein n=1 Tax=Sesamum radiatum TaxID=300843 RepID=A0AAW2W0B4_SESRA